jgi:inner membrane protein
MDNLTHTLVGLMLSRAGLHKLAPRAGLTLMLAANVPDIDVVSGGVSAACYFHYHRWYTHALIAIPLMAVLPVLIVRLFHKGTFPWARVYLVSFIGAASHPLLDYTNGYGIRILLPFSNEWPSLDVNNIIDVWIWAVLLMATAWPALSRLVSSEIGGARTTGRGWAITALLFVVLYSAGKVVLRDRALALQEAHVYDGAAPRRVSVMPSGVNPLLWHGVVETNDFFVRQTVRLWEEFDPTEGRIIHKPQYAKAMEAARGERVFQDMMGFAKALLWSATPDPASGAGVVRVEATELRFGFTALAVVLPNGEVERSWFEFRRP